MSKTKEELMKEVDMKKHKEEQEKHRLQRAQNRKDYLETTMRKQRTAMRCTSNTMSIYANRKAGKESK